MKNFTAWGVVVKGELKSVFLERFHATREYIYYRHMGLPVIVELQVTEESLKDIQKALKKSQEKEE